MGPLGWLETGAQGAPGQRLTRTVTKAARGHGWQLCGTRCGQEHQADRRGNQGSGVSGFPLAEEAPSTRFSSRRPRDAPLPRPHTPPFSLTWFFGLRPSVVEDGRQEGLTKTEILGALRSSDWGR